MAKQRVFHVQTKYGHLVLTENEERAEWQFGFEGYNSRQGGFKTPALAAAAGAHTLRALASQRRRNASTQHAPS